MTIYFAGSEPDCLTGSFTTNTRCDANFARVGIQFTGPASLNLSETPPLGDVWVHFFHVNGNGVYFDSENYFYLKDELGDYLLTASYVDNASVRWRVYGADGASGESTTASVVNGSYDFHYYADGSNVKLNVYINSALVWTAVAANTTPRQLATVNFNSTGDVSGFSEFIVADQDTRGLRVGTYFPSADGTYTDGTGSYADIDETVPDGSAITLTNVGDKHSIAISKYGTQPLSAVLAVAVSGLVSTDGTNDLQVGLRIGGVDYFSDDLNVGLNPDRRNVVWNTHPGGGALMPQDPAADIEVIWKSVA